MKVYIITKGSYSDYHICGISLDKDKAEIIRRRFSVEYERAEIEEYDTDSVEEILRYEHTYKCDYYHDNSSISVRLSNPDYIDDDDYRVKHNSFLNCLRVYVNANTEEEALKFASDKFAKYRAEHMDL